MSNYYISKTKPHTIKIQYASNCVPFSNYCKIAILANIIDVTVRANKKCHMGGFSHGHAHMFDVSQCVIHAICTRTLYLSGDGGDDATIATVQGVGATPITIDPSNIQYQFRTDTGKKTKPRIYSCKI